MGAKLFNLCHYFKPKTSVTYTGAAQILLSLSRRKVRGNIFKLAQQQSTNSPTPEEQTLLVCPRMPFVAYQISVSCVNVVNFTKPQRAVKSTNTSITKILTGLNGRKAKQQNKVIQASSLEKTRARQIHPLV